VITVRPSADNVDSPPIPPAYHCPWLTHTIPNPTKIPRKIILLF
jgi:hypothetical protein